jgi:hypothetical protein
MNNTSDDKPARKPTALQCGIERLRDPGVLDDCKNRLVGLSDVIRANSTLSFDMLYADIPWKTIDFEYLKSLPVKDLVVQDQVAGMLLWADSSCLLDAFKLLRAWGFTFHSVLHIVSYENKAPALAVDEKEKTTETTTTTTTDDASAAAASVPAKTSKKLTAPHGWTTTGIVPSRSRQLLFAYAGDAAGDATFTRIFKDFSFVRKRLSQVSSFAYPEPNAEVYSTALSSKKKNIENWVVYPAYDVYCPSHLNTVFETLVKPTTKVLSLFTGGLSKTWYSWGPNVPGYINGPLRPDSGFGLLCALQKYFSCMKTATVNKYLTLINLYIIQLAKQEGALAVGTGTGTGTDAAAADAAGTGTGSTEPCIGTLVLQRFSDFLADLQRKAESAGGVRDGPFSSLSLVQLKDLAAVSETNPVVRAQLLVQIAQVIKYTIRKISDAASHRKRVVKRKQETGEQGEAKKAAPPRKYGIAAPVNISPELATFMNMPVGSQVARTAVVQFVNRYIVDNSLQNPDKKSEILVHKDDKLLGLLNPDPSFGTVTYFNLCKLLGPHFVRAQA